jgi:ParB family transcriptional regulator, chromosome partitioning protein
MASPVERTGGNLAAHARGEASGLPFDPTGIAGDVIPNLPLHLIETDEHQPRKELGDLAELAASIREHGVLQPILVEPAGDRYRLLAGERRFTAARTAGLKTIPALVRTVRDERRLEVQLIENVQRKDLNPFELAEGYRRLMEAFSISQAQLESWLRERGVLTSRVSINETLTLLRLGQKIREECCRAPDTVPRTVLIEIAREPSGPVQDELWRQARDEKLTARQVRDRRLGRETPRSPGFRMVIPLDHPFKGRITVDFDEPGPGETEVPAMLDSGRAKFRRGW